MWQYEKKLLRPVKIERSDPTSAKIIASQLGGPHGNKLSSFTQKREGRIFSAPLFHLFRSMSKMILLQLRQLKNSIQNFN